MSHSQSQSLLIWEEVPETVHLYLVPDEIITQEQRELLKEAHQNYINARGSENNRGLAFLNAAFYGGEEGQSGVDGEFESVVGIFKNYKVENSPGQPLLGQHITNVYQAGFLL